MKLAMLTLLVLVVSCGRRNSSECRNKESMRLECQIVNTPTYGRPYAQEMCNRTYSADRCY